MSDEKRAQIETILTEAMVKFSATYRGETTRDNNWKCDEWACKFEAQTRPNPAKPYTSERFEFFTGLGHRKENQITVKQLIREGYKRHLHAARFTESAKPVPPHVADVLYSVIMGSSACDQSFSDWCGEYGYDTDSRKAFATYEACQQNADKLKRIFTRAQIDAIRTTLEDY